MRAHTCPQANVSKSQMCDPHLHLCCVMWEPESGAGPVVINVCVDFRCSLFQYISPLFAHFYIIELRLLCGRGQVSLPAANRPSRVTVGVVGLLLLCSIFTPLLLDPLGAEMLSSLSRKSHPRRIPVYLAHP